MDTRIRTAPERAEAEPSARLIPRERMLRGVVTFIVLTAAGIGSLYWFTARGQAHQVWRSLSVPFIALAMLGAAADILIGAERYQIFLRRIRPGTPLWLPIRADLANRFVGAITPSQTGGGPAQVYVLWRGGIPVPDALSFLLINFLSTLIFFRRRSAWRPRRSSSASDSRTAPSTCWSCTASRLSRRASASCWWGSSAPIGWPGPWRAA